MQIIRGCWVEFPELYSRFLIVTYFIYSSAYVSISTSQFISPPFRVLVSLVLIFVLFFGIFVLFILFILLCLFSFVEGCVCVCVCGWLSVSVSSLSRSRFIAACIKDQVFSFNRNGVGGLGAYGEEAPGSLDLVLELLSAPWSALLSAPWSELLSSPSCQSEQLPSSQLQPICMAPAFLDSYHMRGSPSLLQVHLWNLAPGSQPWGQKAARQDGKYSGITTRFLTVTGPNFSWIKDVKVKREPNF